MAFFTWASSGRRATYCRRDPGRQALLCKVTSVPADAEDNVRRFVESMSSEDRMLVVLKYELYEGSWQEMKADLKARLDGGPYIFKLAHRITDDLDRIDRLERFEQLNGADLGDYVKLET